MYYLSTRGQISAADKRTFQDILLEGLAPDGGLYMPQTMPQIDGKTYDTLKDKTFAQKAAYIIGLFAPEWDKNILETITHDAANTFAHKATTPLVQIEDDHFICELFHGPTLAFKDVAMQILVRLMDTALEDKNERVTIIGATSGDTGGAAMDAFKDAHNADIFIFYPKGRVSDVQRKMMTTLDGSHAHAVEIDGTFDDCQALVKALFAHTAFRQKHRISGVNSINWARIVAQIVYYVHALTSLGTPYNADTPPAFAVPTGNFGDVFAGFVAKSMGLPIGDLIVATNDNDILKRVFTTGEYKTDGVVATLSPSMDIQVSSNFERMLFETLGRDAARVKTLMDTLKQSKGFTLKGEELKALNTHMSAYKADEQTLKATMQDVYTSTGYVLDPHTAVAINAVWQHKAHAPKSATRYITLSTAHPAKFPSAIKDVLGFDPVLPERQKGLMSKPEVFTPLANDLNAVMAFIESKK